MPGLAQINRLPAQPGLETVLSGYGRAGHLAQQFLDSLNVYSPDWGASCLTPNGAPVEFGFAEGSTDLRLTTEIGAPGHDLHHRISKATETLARVDERPAYPALLGRLSKAQGGVPLRYGAWIGLRQSTTERAFKFYIEAPPELGDFIDPDLRVPIREFRIAGPAPRRKMIGIDHRSGKIEVYYGLTDPLRSVIPALLEPAGLSDQSGDILGIIDSVWKFSSGARLPTRDLGFSYAWVPGQIGISVTFYLVTQSLFGDDATAAEAFAELPNYHIISRSLDANGQMHHGMVGITVAHGLARPIVSVGVAPKWQR